VNWAYVAGFFDGEGHVGRGLGAHRICVTIAQKMREPLDQMKAFLERQNIRSGISKKRDKTGVQYLSISALDHVRSFLAAVRPYVIVKKQVTEDTWRYLTMWPMLSNHVRSKMALEHRWWGHTKPTPEERRALDRACKKTKYYSDPLFRRRCIERAVARNRRLRAAYDTEKLNGSNGHE
jgi:LAGLIDADG DNA endonuclease family protein